MASYLSNSVRDGLWFSIEIEKDEFLAFISTEALDAHFKAPPRQCDAGTAAVASYRANRSVIDAVARQKFLSGFPRPIKLGAADF